MIDVKLKLVLNGIFRSLLWIKDRNDYQLKSILGDIVNIIDHRDPPENYWFIGDSRCGYIYSDDLISKIKISLMDYGFLLSRDGVNVEEILLDLKKYISSLMENHGNEYEDPGLST